MTITCRTVIHLLFIFSLTLCLVESRPVDADDADVECRPGYVQFDRDCIEIKLIKELRRLLCELTKNLSSDNELVGLHTFCGSGSREEDRRHWGNEGMGGKRIFGNGGMKRGNEDKRDFELSHGMKPPAASRTFTDEKRAWWNSGLKPDGR